MILLSLSSNPRNALADLHKLAHHHSEHMLVGPPASPLSAAPRSLASDGRDKQQPAKWRETLMEVIVFHLYSTLSLTMRPPAGCGLVCVAHHRRSIPLPPLLPSIVRRRRLEVWLRSCSEQRRRQRGAAAGRSRGSTSSVGCAGVRVCAAVHVVIGPVLPGVAPAGVLHMPVH